MSGPFYNNIKGTTGSAPGTGAFTPNGAAPGSLAWSTVPSGGYIGLVRFDDGDAWELRYSFWNGTTLSRTANSLVASSTGSDISLSANATASLVPDAHAFQHFSGNPARSYLAGPNSDTIHAVGLSAATVTGTVSALGGGSSTIKGSIPRAIISSLTTANSWAGLYSSSAVATGFSTAGSPTKVGGFLFSSRFGLGFISQTTGIRMVSGMVGSVFIGSAEPSAHAAVNAFFGKDSTDTNMQFIYNLTGSGAGTKVDTGIGWGSNTSWFDAKIWNYPGSTTCYALLIDLINGTVFYTSVSGFSLMSGYPMTYAGLTSTTGTACVLEFSGMSVRSGGY